MMSVSTISNPIDRYLRSMDLYTVAQIASKYQISTQRVYAIAKARGVKGQWIGEMRVFSASEVKELKPGRPGRPWPKQEGKTP